MDGQGNLRTGLGQYKHGIRKYMKSQLLRQKLKSMGYSNPHLYYAYFGREELLSDGYQ